VELVRLIQEGQDLADDLRNAPAPSAGGTANLPLWSLLALATAAFTAAVAQLLPAGLLPQFRSGLHVSQGRIGLLVGDYAAASFLAASPSPRPCVACPAARCSWAC